MQIKQTPNNKKKQGESTCSNNKSKRQNLWFGEVMIECWIDSDMVPKIFYMIPTQIFKLLGNKSEQLMEMCQTHSQTSYSFQKQDWYNNKACKQIYYDCLRLATIKQTNPAKEGVGTITVWLGNKSEQMMDGFQTHSQTIYILPNQHWFNKTCKQIYDRLRLATIKQTNPVKEGVATITA